MMRVSALFALAALLASVTMAESALKRRQLSHEYNVDDSRSEYYTITFNRD